MYIQARTVLVCALAIKKTDVMQIGTVLTCMYMHMRTVPICIPICL
ncbi:hypothetical protein SBF1_740005 [Candidatus Desulfosporosinus infrequens]|uniref:Uncharacterized protein n=1 Tax=Candidatus Desulfosporosinus infrequens TaxID=2043169 RepID=A0A2U3LQR1_9FIRM|nr:hypothetical protein SBF1_740005 [Candidatus Desulfosporosinus infrequens]